MKRNCFSRETLSYLLSRDAKEIFYYVVFFYYVWFIFFFRHFITFFNKKDYEIYIYTHTHIRFNDIRTKSLKVELKTDIFNKKKFFFRNYNSIFVFILFIKIRFIHNRLSNRKITSFVWLEYMWIKIESEFRVSLESESILDICPNVNCWKVVNFVVQEYII